MRSGSGVGWVGKTHQCAGDVDARIADSGIVQPFGLGEAEKSVAGDVHFGWFWVDVDADRAGVGAVGSNDDLCRRNVGPIDNVGAVILQQR